MRASDRVRPETGATLILAIIFLTVIGLVAVALGTMATDGLRAASGLSSQRTTEYAADGAVEAAIQAVRYSYSYYPSAAWCLPPLSGATGSSTPVDGFQVACSGSQSPYSSSTRTITFSACQGLSATTCAGPPGHGQLIQASVSLDDWTLSPVVDTCTHLGTATCGTGITINSWVVLTTNS